jgi:predicted nucleic acid-binding protein
LIILDTSGVYAFKDESADEHAEVRRAVESDPGPFILSPFVLAELDYLVSERLGQQVERELLEDVANGAYELAEFGPDDVVTAMELIDRYADLKLGLADASVAVLAGRHRTTRLLTLDERDFRPMRPLYGAAFTLLPADVGS